MYVPKIGINVLLINGVHAVLQWIPTYKSNPVI